MSGSTIIKNYKNMEKTKIRELTLGEFFRLSDSENAPVWVRGEYDRSTRKYECYKYDDVNHWSEFCGKRIVFAADY